jgi:hypothetical protein
MNMQCMHIDFFEHAQTNVSEPNHRSSSSSTLQQVLVGRGFKTFSESAQMTRGVGIPDSYFDTFIGHQLQGFTVPPQYQQQLANYIQDIHYIDEEEWSALDMQFSIDAGGTCKYAAVMSRLRNDTKHDWMSCNLQATFSLAPDVYVIQKSSSILGGLFSKTEDTFKIVPRGLTMDDINAIFSYLKVTPKVYVGLIFCMVWLAHGQPFGCTHILV